MQVIGQENLAETTYIKIEQGIAEQVIVIGLEPDFPARNQKVPVLHQLPWMGQTAFFMPQLWPGIAEVNPNLSDGIIRAKITLNVFNITFDDMHVLYGLAFRRLFNVSACVPQDVGGDVDGQIIHVRVLVHHLRC